MAKLKEGSCGQGRCYNFEKNWNAPALDYQTYSLNIREYVQYTTIWIGISMLFAYTFYHNVFVSIIGLIGLPVYWNYSKQQLKEKRTYRLRAEFKDAIQFMEGYLRSGYSIENAMEKSRDDVMRMCGKNSYMEKELNDMIGQMRMNIPVEDVWERFASRCGIFQIEQFASVFRIAKRSGGNLSIVIRSSMAQITEQIRAEEEIQTLLTSKILQMKVMNLIPVAILLYVGFASSDLLQVMYETIIGRIVMSVCLCIYIGAYCIGEKMMKV